MVVSLIKCTCGSSFNIAFPLQNMLLSCLNYQLVFSYLLRVSYFFFTNLAIVLTFLLILYNIKDDNKDEKRTINMDTSYG